MTLDSGEEPGKLFVGGLSWETTVEKLSEYFASYGEVSDCVVMKNAETGRSRGFGFVTFKDPSCVHQILSSGPHQLDDRTIDPKSCNAKSAQKGKKEAKMTNHPKVFLGGLPPDVNETVLRDFFSKYGKVIEVVIMYDQEKKKTRGNGFRGFGFLSFENDEAVNNVVSEHYVTINGKKVEVKRAEPRDKAAAPAPAPSNKQQHQGNGHQNPQQVPQQQPSQAPQHQLLAPTGVGLGHPGHGGPANGGWWPPPPGHPAAGVQPPPHAIPALMQPSAPYPPSWGAHPAPPQPPYGPGAWSPPAPGYQGYPPAAWPYGPGYPPNPPPSQGWSHHQPSQAYPYGTASYPTTYPGYGQPGVIPPAPMTGGVPPPAGAMNGYGSPNSGPCAGHPPPPPVASIATPMPPHNPPNPSQQGGPPGHYAQDASSYGPARVYGFGAPVMSGYHSYAPQAASENGARTQHELGQGSHVGGGYNSGNNGGGHQHHAPGLVSSLYGAGPRNSSQSGFHPYRRAQQL